VKQSGFLLNVVHLACRGLASSVCPASSCCLSTSSSGHEGRLIRIHLFSIQDPNNSSDPYVVFYSPDSLIAEDRPLRFRSPVKVCPPFFHGHHFSKQHAVPQTQRRPPFQPKTLNPEWKEGEINPVPLCVEPSAIGGQVLRTDTPF
jgi:hypothetical protein